MLSCFNYDFTVSRIYQIEYFTVLVEIQLHYGAIFGSIGKLIKIQTNLKIGMIL